MGAYQALQYEIWIRRLFVQGIGGAAGLVTDFALLKSGVGQLGKTGLAADLHVAPILRNPLGLTAVTGGFYGGLLTPTNPKYGNQFESRLKNTALTAATFTAMEGLSTKLAPLTESDSKLGGLAKTIGINAGAGMPIGLLNTQAESLLFDHKLAGLNQTAQAGIDWAVIGGVLNVTAAIRSASSERHGTRLDSATTNDGTAATGDKSTNTSGVDSKATNNGLREFKVVSGQKDLDAFRQQDKAGVMLKVRELTDSGAGMRRSLWVQHSENDLATQAQSADLIAMCHAEESPADIAQKRVSAAGGELYMSPGSKTDRIYFGDRAMPSPGTWAPIKLDKAVANPFLDELKQRGIPIDDRGFPSPDILDAKERYSWALPEDKALSLIKKSAPEGITEIMAGKGYWAHLLQQMGVDITAYDRQPPTESRTHYHDAGTFTQVEKGDHMVAAEHPEKAMMLCWPPYAADQARQGLQAYMDAGGQKLIYIGERSKGCTGNDGLYRLIQHNWQSIETLPLAVGGWLDIYERRPEPYKGPFIPPSDEASPRERMLIANDLVRSAQDKFDDITTKYGANRGDLKDFGDRLFSLDDGELTRLGVSQDWYKSTATVSFPDGSHLTFIQPQPGAMARELYRYDFEDSGIPVSMETGQLQNRKWEGSMRLGSALNLDVDLRVELSGTNMTAPQLLEIEHQDNDQSFSRLPDGSLEAPGIFLSEPGQSSNPEAREPVKVDATESPYLDDTTTPHFAPENQGGVFSRLRKLVGLKDSPPVEWGERPQESAQALGLKLPQMTEQQMALSDSTVLSANRDGRGSMGLEKYLAEVQLPDGTVQPAMIRAFPGGWFSTSRFRHEQAAYHLNSLIGFDNGYPTSALCTFEKNGEPIRAWIQDASGRTFGDGMRRLAAERYGDSGDNAVSQMVKEDPQLRSQVEQAFIERLIYGDRDPSEFNMVLTPDLRVQNIDLDTSFHDYHQPQLDSSPAYGINHRLLNDFRNQPLSGITLGKIDSFVRRYNNPTGHEQLMELGLTSSEATSMMRRAEWFARHKVFPDVKTSIM